MLKTYEIDGVDVLDCRSKLTQDVRAEIHGYIAEHRFCGVLVTKVAKDPGLTLRLIRRNDLNFRSCRGKPYCRVAMWDGDKMKTRSTDVDLAEIIADAKCPDTKRPPEPKTVSKSKYDAPEGYVPTGNLLEVSGIPIVDMRPMKLGEAKAIAKMDARHYGLKKGLFAFAERGGTLLYRFRWHPGIDVSKCVGKPYTVSGGRNRMAVVVKDVEAAVLDMIVENGKPEPVSLLSTVLD